MEPPQKWPLKADLLVDLTETWTMEGVEPERLRMCDNKTKRTSSLAVRTRLVGELARRGVVAPDDPGAGPGARLDEHVGSPGAVLGVLGPAAICNTGRHSQGGGGPTGARVPA